MTRGLPKALTALALALALTGCIGSADPPLPRSPTPDEEARTTYARIVSAADAILLSDQLGYFGADDDLERAGVRCLVDVCSTAFSRLARPNAFSIEDVELELLGERRGISLFVERASLSSIDVHVYAGWLDHSFFATESVLLTGAAWPDHGATVVYGYSVGASTRENPSSAAGTARWEGLMIGREMTASPARGQVILGDAGVTVHFGSHATAADVEFTNIANTESGAQRDGMAWHGMLVSQGGFARRDAADNTISGRFFGPNEEEVGGVFEREGVAGVFGGRRVSD